jgi:pantoate--beta-alanine ligase
VRQFNLPICVIEAETCRADDGLALSSRNGYLTPEERAEAPRLHRLLSGAAARLRAGARDSAPLEAEVAGELARHGWHVDYVSVRSRSTLMPPRPDERERVILAAARLGGTRLIDNIEC